MTLIRSAALSLVALSLTCTFVVMPLAATGSALTDVSADIANSLPFQHAGTADTEVAAAASRPTTRSARNDASADRTAAEPASAAGGKAPTFSGSAAGTTDTAVTTSGDVRPTRDISMGGATTSLQSLATAVKATTTAEGSVPRVVRR